jgi:hypothetical protein
LFKPPNPTQTKHHPHGPDDAFRTIKHPLLNISGHDGMDERDIGLRKWLVPMGILAWKLRENVLDDDSFFKPQPLLRLSTIHIGQMMPSASEPSNIIIWIYQDMMEWMSRTLV